MNNHSFRRWVQLVKCDCGKNHRLDELRPIKRDGKNVFFCNFCGKQILNEKEKFKNRLKKYMEVKNG